MDATVQVQRLTMLARRTAIAAAAMPVARQEAMRRMLAQRGPVQEPDARTQALWRAGEAR